MDKRLCKICGTEIIIIDKSKRGKKPITCSVEHAISYHDSYQKQYRKIESANKTDNDRLANRIIEKEYRDNLPADKKAARAEKRKIVRREKLSKLSAEERQALTEKHRYYCRNRNQQKRELAKEGINNG